MKMNKIVLQKYIADSGYCSRRNAEELIREGRVEVNGQDAQLGMRVSEEDDVRIGNTKIKPVTEKIYIKLFKPHGYTCTTKSFKAEKNIFELVRVQQRLFVVGRLDKDSRGLVLLTNDGDLTAQLTHPRNRHEKEYLVTVNNQQFSASEVDAINNKFKRGIDIKEKNKARAKEVAWENNKFRVILTEGKKRQLRRMFGAVDCKVKDLLRIRIENLKLGDLQEGQWAYLTEDEIKSLKNQ